MTSFTGVLCVEGEPTGDGRLIQQGALTWPEMPIPLMSSFDAGAVIGKVTRVWRDGDTIRCEGEGEPLNADGLAMGVKLDSYEIEDAEGQGASIVELLFDGEGAPLFVTTAARLSTVVVTPEPAFTEARLTRA